MDGRTGEPDIVDAKYVFVDVVGFTRGRTVEAQVDIVATLNAVVTGAVEQTGVPEANIVYLPTGDGLCVAFLDVPRPFDVHMLAALAIASGVQSASARASTDDRRFGVRIGLAQNADNAVVDINGRRNVAGVGVSTAQRVMSVADEGQILVAESVYGVLQAREKYLGAFRRFEASVKHGVSLPVFQFVGQHSGVNVDVPSSIATAQRPLSRVAAFYLAFAIANREIFTGAHCPNACVASVVCYLFALTAYDAERGVKKNWFYYLGNSIEEAILYFDGDRPEREMTEPLADLLKSSVLATIADCFDPPRENAWIWVNDRGWRRLAEDHPDLYARFLRVPPQRDLLS